MKKFLALFAVVLLVAGCSDKPSEGKIHDLFSAAMAKSEGDKLVDISDFKQTNGVEQADKTYVADVAYDVTFKLGADEITTKLGPDGLGLAMPLVMKYGPFKAGDIKHNEQKITLEKSENGWVIKDIK